MKTLENFQTTQLPTNKLRSIIGGAGSMVHCNRETGNPLTDKCIDTNSVTSDDNGKVIATGNVVCCH
jgi:hypothetical protein